MPTAPSEEESYPTPQNAGRNFGTLHQWHEEPPPSYSEANRYPLLTVPTQNIAAPHASQTHIQQCDTNQSNTGRATDVNINANQTDSERATADSNGTNQIDRERLKAAIKLKRKYNNFNLCIFSSCI